jgi:multiubiquitin
MELNENQGDGLNPAGEAELLEEVEIEEHGKKGHRPPRAKRYVIRIDKTKYTVHVSHMTGRQLLELAGKVPPDQYTISMKLHGGRVKPIGLDEEVHFHEHEIERFMTLPLDQTEG